LLNRREIFVFLFQINCTMKIVQFFALMLIFSVYQANAQAGAHIKFEKLVHDFGQLTQGDPATVEFTFTNTGDASLQLSNVRSSCGCTIPTWPHDPIAPGKTGSITVKYDSNRVGIINKQVTVESNAVNNSVILKISGEVKKKPEEVMPFQNFDNSGSPFVQ